LDDDTLHEEFNWLRPLYVRPYWGRVWIVQELVLAKVVVVCCGDKSIDFDDIYGLSLDWGSFELGFDTGNYQKRKPYSTGWTTIQPEDGASNGLSFMISLGRRLSISPAEAWTSRILHRIRCAHFHQLYKVAIEDA
jgi:hypothetical protein